MLPAETDQREVVWFRAVLRCTQPDLPRASPSKTVPSKLSQCCGDDTRLNDFASRHYGCGTSVYVRNLTGKVKISPALTANSAGGGDTTSPCRYDPCLKMTFDPQSPISGTFPAGPASRSVSRQSQQGLYLRLQRSGLSALHAQSHPRLV